MAPPPRPRPAPPAPQVAPPGEPTAAPAAQAPAAPAASPQVAAAPAPAAAATAATAAPAAPAPAPAAPAPTQTAAAPATPAAAEAPKAAVPAAPTPAASAPSPPPQVAADTPPAAAPKAAEKAAPAPAKAAGARDPMPKLAADSPARMLDPPINVRRAEMDLEGVGNAVRVRTVSQAAQDTVGTAYSALVRGEYDTALGFYDRALKQEPNSVLALLGRGASLQKLGRKDEARVAYDHALKIDPQNREALSNLTSIESERAPGDALSRLMALERDYPGFTDQGADRPCLCPYGQARRRARLFAPRSVDHADGDVVPVQYRSRARSHGAARTSCRGL